jgi:transporter family-2 protein
MTKSFYIFITVVTGMLIPIQAGLNAALKKGSGDPFFAGSWNAFVATLILLVAFVIAKMSLQSKLILSTVPWWAFLGGVCGAIYILVSLVSAPKLGGVLLVTCLVAGQIISSIVIDHFGLVGYAVRPITLMKFTGVLLIIFGVYLIQK